LDLGNPLLNLWGVGGRDGVKLRVISGNNGCGWSFRVNNVNLVLVVRMLTVRQRGSTREECRNAPSRWGGC